MFSANHKISLRQLQALLILDIFGTSVITLPRITAEIAGQNGWMLIAGAGIIIYLYVQLLHRLSMRYPDMTFVEIAQKLTTRPLGIVLSVGLAVKILLTTGLQLRVFCEIIKQTMLMRTPLWVNGVAMLLVAAYVSYKGYEIRGRTAEILLVVMLIPLIFVFMLACFHTDFTNLLPVTSVSGGTLLKGSLITAFSFQGVEFLLLIHPFVKKPEKVGKVAGQAVIAIAALMILTTIITIARFGPEDVKIKLWPVLQIMDTIDIPGSFIERQDVVVMRFWVISTFAGVNAGIFLISLIGKRLINKHGVDKKIVLLSLPLLLVISLFPDNIAQTYDWLMWCNKYIGALFFILVPVALFITSKLRTKGGDSNEIS